MKNQFKTGFLILSSIAMLALACDPPKPSSDKISIDTGKTKIDTIKKDSVK